MKNVKRLLSLSLLLSMLAAMLLASSTVQGAQINPKDKISNAIVLMIGRAESYSKGLPAMVDSKNPDVCPVVKDGRTFVPVRFIAENFGAKVGWDGQTSTATITLGDKVIKLTLGSSTMTVNGQEITLDVPADSINDRTFIPLRALTDVLGKKLFWDNRGLIVISENEKLFDTDKDKALIDAVVGMFNEDFLNVYVDPRVELISIIQYLSGYGERMPGRITRYDFEYKRKIDEYFKPYKDHAAVKTYTDMKNFVYDNPPAIMLYMSIPPELELLYPMDSTRVKNAGGDKKLDSFLTEVRDFAAKSDFMSFYNSNKALYNDIIDGFYQDTESNLINNIEEYLGLKHHSYNVILAPLYHNGGYATRIERNDGTSDIFSIEGPQGTKQDKPIFAQSKESIEHLVWHEFGHSFINPLGDKYWGELSKYNNLAAPMAQYISQPGWSYGKTWNSSMVNEHVIRAVTSRLANKYYGKNVGEARLKSEINSGFVYDEKLYKCLEEYENNRDKYPTFNDFYPRLVAVFKKASEEMAASKAN